MTIDPVTGADLSRTEPRRNVDDPIRRSLEEQTPSFWLPIAVAVALLLGVAYYFFGNQANPNAMRADNAVTQSKPSPH